MSRLMIIRLREEGFGKSEEELIKVIILVPFVLEIVYFTVDRRLCKVELRRWTFRNEPGLPIETRHSPHSERSAQYHLVGVNMAQIIKEHQKGCTVFLMELYAQGR